MKKIEANDPLARSADLVGENIAQLRRLFPEAFVEGKIDFDVLKQLLGGAVEDREERYGLNWHGKRAARQLAYTPSTATLRPLREKSLRWDETRNVLIEGENLETLKLIHRSLSQRVDLIYIDPPYNTGRNDLVYRDSFADGLANYHKIVGRIDESGQATTSEKDGGHTHTNWLKMILPRLTLAKQLLSDDGLILISIDDREFAGLRLILDEIFGQENCLAVFSWRTDGNFDNQAKVKVSHEYIVAYCKNINAFPHPPIVDPSISETSKLNNADIINTIIKNGPKNPVQQITLPSGFPASTETADIDPRQDRWPHIDSRIEIRNRKTTTQAILRSGWASRDQLDEYIAGGFKPILDSKGQITRFHITQNGAIEAIKERGVRSHVISTLSGFGGTQKATAELAQLGVSFSGYPKPIQLIKYFIQFISKDSGIFLDFFGGSGTTAHAVAQLNDEDKGTRRFILVQLPEPLDPANEAHKNALRFCIDSGLEQNLFEIARERLQRALKPLSTGFRVFKLDSSNLRAWDPETQNLAGDLLEHARHDKSDRTDEDLLYEVILKRGLDLCIDVAEKTIAGKTVFSVGGGILVCCFAQSIGTDEVDALGTGIADWIAEQKPADAPALLFRDSAFADDVGKTNLTETLRQRGLDNVRSL